MSLPPYLAAEADHQRLTWLGGSTVEVLLDAARTGGQLMVTRSILGDGDASPLHVHGHEDEVFVVLDGELAFWVGDERRDVGAGGVAFLPRALPHAYRVLSGPAQVLTLCTPAGFEEFFRQAGHDQSTPAPEGWAVGPAELASAMARAGGQILGPPPAA